MLKKLEEEEEACHKDIVSLAALIHHSESTCTRIEVESTSIVLNSTTDNTGFLRTTGNGYIKTFLKIE